MAAEIVPIENAPRVVSWESLATAVDECGVCAGLAPTRRTTVPGVLPPASTASGLNASDISKGLGLKK